MNQRKDGNKDCAKIIMEISNITPTRGKKIRHAWQAHKRQQEATQMTTDEALGLIISASLSVHQYKLLRKQALKLNHDIYPAYNKVLDAKNNSYPDEISITEEICEAKLQAPLNHTVKRLLVNISNELKTGNYILKFQWGFNGSSGFSEYKQSTLSGSSDSNLFVTSMVPIYLANEVDNHVIWQNPACSLTRYCRPIRLQYAKETIELSLNEENYLSQQISQLTPYIHDKGAVKFSMDFTMIDGKICNAVTETSSMKCYICNLNISQMNKLKLMKNVVVN
ncbi:uncharacterized protein LOC112688501 [Sipha flava]|uniref:Uncharacterized protein LOC112688501 n=1 Tax=Sipha flava TaxID=143950 RepID=A0A8B8G4K3_9HEMI|nr:uncharacterized protein LOC112688501 [Sipha flava]